MLTLDTLTTAQWKLLDLVFQNVVVAGQLAIIAPAIMYLILFY